MMISRVSTSVRPVSERDRRQLSSLIQLEPYVHRHLDWRPPLDWIGHQPYLVAERDGHLIAALACPPDPPGVAWIRTFATMGHSSITQTWQLLWKKIAGELRDQTDVCVAAIPLYTWFRKLLKASDFIHTHNVVLLAWEGQKPPPPGKKQSAVFRPMTPEDLPSVTNVDNAAFKTLWRNSLDALTLAYQQAAHATVAEDESGVIGYQISTPSPHGWHLARLAVLPSKQRRGVAYTLTRDVMIQCLQKRATHISVNTQNDNEASLYLYAKAGFQPTGEEYPVYQYCLHGTGSSG